MLEIDLKNYLENLVGCSVWPTKIPQTEGLPAIVYKEIGNSRNENSSLSKSNLKDQIIQLTLVSVDSEWLILNKHQIIEALDGYSGMMGNTKIFNSRINNAISGFDNKQQNFEYYIDVLITVNRGNGE